MMESDSIELLWSSWPSLLILSLVFALALVLNASSLPIILFRKTKFGNGLFAVLILCLTLSDLLVTIASILGSILIEATNFTLLSSKGICKLYHWLSMWTTGLSAYLLVALIAMVMVKTTDSCLQRLRDCRYLLLALLTMSGLYALPELLVRSSVKISGQESVCILSVQGPLFVLYTLFGTILRHLLPCLLVLVTVLRPETKLSKRVSLLFFGHLAVPCRCGENGSVLSWPHECPAMQNAMISNTQNRERKRASKKARINQEVETGSDSSAALMASVAQSKSSSLYNLQPEDRPRKRYKFMLATAFVTASILNVALNVLFQIESSRQASMEPVWDADNSSRNNSSRIVSSWDIWSSSASRLELLTCLMYGCTHLQQLFDPLAFLLVEFVFS